MRVPHSYDIVFGKDFLMGHTVHVTHGISKLIIQFEEISTHLVDVCSDFPVQKTDTACTVVKEATLAEPWNLGHIDLRISEVPC